MMYKYLYCTLACFRMAYRVGVSEETMERLRKYVRAVHKGAWSLPGERGNSKYGFTVEDLLCELLSKEGF